MKGFVAPVEAVLDERAQHAVLLVVAVKEGANVTMPAECGSGDLHRVLGGVNISPPGQAPRTERASVLPCKPTVWDRRFDPARGWGARGSTLFDERLQL